MKTMLWRVGWCVGLLATVALQAKPEEGNDEELIVPGRSIGQAELGLSGRMPKSVPGEKSFGDVALAQNWVTTYGKPGADGKADSLLVYYHRDEAGKSPALQIAVTSAFFHTQGGVSTRSDPTAIWREFPELRYALQGDESRGQGDVELYDDVGRGIAFAIERVKNPAPGQAWGQCRAIMVHQPGREPSFFVPKREVPMSND